MWFAREGASTGDAFVIVVGWSQPNASEGGMRHVWTVLHVLMAVLFLLSAAVQYNDPDPTLWITIYTGAALLCLQAAARLLLVPIAWAWCLGSLAVGIWAVATGLDELVLSMDNELARELGGLVITATWMGVVASQDAALRRERLALAATSRVSDAASTGAPK